ncbi:hypothetical protein [Massilia scottii]|uniref:hypothetical protein n=1 Tax=Massilia scottii TaxID=3057166 RepID=UPI002796DF98|nr:hypothetical protein [Massilia sp. CCM 9029]MDQ1835342.1 hypothetical protein [Massilia sp. CCM 9029]
MRLLAPALVKVASRRVVLLQPPHCPQILALGGMGLATPQVLWIKSKGGPDALWAAEQVPRSGSALLFWPSHVRPEALRRLNLAAQAGETLFFMLRPIAAAQDASPGTAASAAGAQRDGRGIRQAPRSTT